MRDADAPRRRWRISQRMTGWLVAAWFGVTFGITFFARELGGVVLGGPLSFWVAAQGASLVYLVLVVLYVVGMNRLDARDPRTAVRPDA